MCRTSKFPEPGSKLVIWSLSLPWDVITSLPFHSKMFVGQSLGGKSAALSAHLYQPVPGMVNRVDLASAGAELEGLLARLHF